MPATDRLNFLLSDILDRDRVVSNTPNSSDQTRPLLTFSEHDYHRSAVLPSTTAGAPIVPRRNPSSFRQLRQRHSEYVSSIEKQSSISSHLPPAQPLLNSSTLDDLFRALTLECEQYIADSLISDYPKKTAATTTKSMRTTTATTTMEASVGSNDDDYENLNRSIPSEECTRNLSLLKTSIQVSSPAPKQIISSRISSTSIVPPSRTFPLMSSASSTKSTSTASIIPSHHCQSTDDGEDNSMTMSTSSTTTRRRRRRCLRKPANTSSMIQSSSSEDERIDVMNSSMIEKRSNVSKRSVSSTTEHRNSRIKNVSSSSSSTSSRNSQMKLSRRRDISLQHADPPPPPVRAVSPPIPFDVPRFPVNLYSPLSVLLTSTRTTSDFLDRSDYQRQSRLQFVNHHHHQNRRAPDSMLFDRVHPSYHRSTSQHHSTTNNSIPTHRVTSYPVY